MSDLTIEWLTDSDLASVQQFLDEHWSKGHVLSRDSELFRWQYSGPASGQMQVLVAKREFAIVGMLGVIPVDFTLKGERVRGGWHTMWRALPESGHPRLGLDILQRAIKEFPVSGTLGGNATTIKILRVLGFKIKDKVARWVKPINQEALANLLTVLGPDYRNSALSRWIDQHPNGIANLGHSASEYEIIEWSAESHDLWDDAWNNRFSTQLVSVWRDSAYVNWRYAQHPTFDYVSAVARNLSTGEAEGLLVFRLAPVRDREETVVRIVEFLSTSTAAAPLLSWLDLRLQGTNAAFADFYCTSMKSDALLSQGGFYQEDEDSEPLPSLFQPLDISRSALNFALYLPTEHRSIFDEAELYFTKSDCDQDRPN